jgi:pimeloyl-ACP methyl ester carboxylesterase
MAEDLEMFMQEHGMERPTLIGHSMGAKVAMTVALRQKFPIANLIPVDNAPVDAALKSDFGTYVEGMREIEEAVPKVQTLQEADAILKLYEEALPVRQFLLTNLMQDEEGNQKWRIPLRYLARALHNLSDFPFSDPDVARWGGPTLFVRGTKSHYIADEMLPIIGRFFPKFELRDIDAGHWVISEKPADFREGINIPCSAL